MNGKRMAACLLSFAIIIVNCWVAAAQAPPDKVATTLVAANARRLLNAPDQLNRARSDEGLTLCEDIWALCRMVETGRASRAAAAEAVAKVAKRPINEEPWSSKRPRPLSAWERVRLDAVLALAVIDTQAAAAAVDVLWGRSTSPVVWRHLEELSAVAGFRSPSVGTNRKERKRRATVVSEAKQSLRTAPEALRKLLGRAASTERLSVGGPEFALRRNCAAVGVLTNLVDGKSRTVLADMLGDELVRPRPPPCLNPGRYSFLDPGNVYSELVLDALENVPPTATPTRQLAALSEKTLKGKEARRKLHLARERYRVWLRVEKAAAQK